MRVWQETVHRRLQHGWAVRYSGTWSLKCVFVAGGKGTDAKQDLVYATPVRTPAVFGGWVRDKDAVAHPQFYLDIEYADGSWEWVLRAADGDARRRGGL